MIDIDIATLIVRGANLLLWVILGCRIIQADRPVSGMARNVITLVIMFGMAVLFFGALVPFGLDGQVARLVYTAFTAASAIVAISLLTTGEPNGTMKASPPDDDLPLPPPQ